jgi:UDP:flavonoid glycosyltransferase YjiC (YdhE family)
MALFHGLTPLIDKEQSWEYNIVIVELVRQPDHSPRLPVLQPGLDIGGSLDISIVSAGSRGDVQPYVALGVGLQEAGHSVRFLAPSDYKKLAVEHQLEFIDLGGNMQSVAQGLEGQLEQGNMLKIMFEMRGAASRLIGEATERSVKASEGSDIVLAGLGALSIAVTTSEALDIPYVPAFLYPFTPTSEFASVLSPIHGKRIPGWANRATFHFAQQMMWQAFRSADNNARQERLGIERSAFWGPFSRFHNSKLPVLYGYSKHVVPVPSDWDDFNIVTGFWFLEPSQEWQPPSSLQKFLESGPPPVYIGFGSMVNQDPKETARMVIAALERSGQRGIVGSGWGGMQEKDLPDCVHLVGSVPHTWLFPRMAAVVHHGGVGTTAAGLRAGIPSIITPFFGDQPYWGHRIFELGVGPKPIPKKQLDSDNLARAISIAVRNQKIRNKAAELGSKIRSEHGVSKAVQVLEQKFNSA